MKRILLLAIPAASFECSPSSVRRDCGYYGITEDECAQKGCCWTLPGPGDQIEAADLPICYYASDASKTQFAVHYLPWMTGPGTAHWCNTNYGNSYYGSVIGQWSCEDTSVLQWQAQLMQAAGIDGIFFDYQMQEWNSCVDKMVAVLKNLGLKYALMPDTAEGADFLSGAMPYVKQRMQDENYFRHEGKPLLPLFDFTGDKAPSTEQLRQGLGDVVIVARSQSALLSGADAYYQWISGADPSSIDGYYDNPPAGTPALVGGAWRGFEACYAKQQPYLDHYANSVLLRETVKKALERQPPFCQLMTWNDYTEGTMMEPSVLIHDKINGCNSIASCANGEVQGGTPDCSLPYCADGTECRTTSPHCQQCNDGQLCSPYRDLITLYKLLVDNSKSDEDIEAIFMAIPKPAGAPFGAAMSNASVVV